MTAVKRMTVRILSEEFYKPKDELREYTSIKKRVSELEIPLEKSNNDKNDQVKVIKALEQKIEHFENKSEMKKHMQEKHPKKIQCNQCDQTFTLNIDLEVNLKTHEKKSFLNVLTFTEKKLLGEHYTSAHEGRTEWLNGIKWLNPR